MKMHDSLVLPFSRVYLRLSVSYFAFALEI